MHTHDPALHEAFGVGGRDELRIEHVAHARRGELSGHRDGRDRDRKKGQHDVLVVAEAVDRQEPAAARVRAEHDHRDLQEVRDEERWDRRRESGDREHRAARERAPSDGAGDRADQHAERQRDRRGADQQHRAAHSRIGDERRQRHLVQIRQRYAAGPRGRWLSEPSGDGGRAQGAGSVDERIRGVARHRQGRDDCQRGPEHERDERHACGPHRDAHRRSSGAASASRPAM